MLCTQLDDVNCDKKEKENLYKYICITHIVYEAAIICHLISSKVYYVVYII